ncbi:hypothetical protein, partial [Streptomyces albidoflavus]|uniref:hypothetical protein n=2 Tax=Streptomyces TaxID=1883 RepID=UPI0040570B01
MSTGKSADRENGSATQHSPKHRAQSPRGSVRGVRGAVAPSAAAPSGALRRALRAWSPAPW